MSVSSGSTSDPAAGVIHLADFSQVAGMFGRWQGPMEQVSGGRFEGALQVVSGRLVRLIRIMANQRVTFHGYDASRMFMAFPVTERNGGSMWYGHRFAPGHLVFQSGDIEAEHLSARRTDNHGAFIHPEALAEAARTLVADSVVLPNAWGSLAPPPDMFAELNRRYFQLLDRGLADPSVLGTPEGDRLEQECVRALVAVMFSAVIPHQVFSLPARSKLFRRAEEYMRAHLGDPVGAIDLARELGVSDRTLRLVFRERVGLGPMAYFKCLRLNAVRGRLRTAPGVSIGDVAVAFGFHHLGNFAADYRRLFGERPFETLRRVSNGQR